MDWLGRIIDEMKHEEEYEACEELIELVALSILADGNVNHEQLDKAIEIYRNYPNPPFSPMEFIEQLQEMIKEWKDKPQVRDDALTRMIENIIQNGRWGYAETMLAIFDADGGSMSPREKEALMKLGDALRAQGREAT